MRYIYAASKAASRRVRRVTPGALGLAVAGGLLVSQLLTLYITPVVYYYMDRIADAVRDQYE